MRLVLIQKIILTRKVFPISTYTCNESEDTQTHHILVRAKKEQYCSGMTHLSVTQIVTSTPCWSALFSSNFPNTPSWYREKRTVTESDETALGSRASVQRFKSSAEEMGDVKRTGVDQNKGIWDLN